MKKKPNIIFVFADQMRSQVLGCYGNKQVATPNFDKLAKDGAKFTNALSTWPVCSPFRATLLTGQYPMNNGTVTNDTAIKDGLTSIATVCKDNGYETGYIGKWHLEWNRNPFVPKNRRMGFDFWAVRNCNHNHFDSYYCGQTNEHIPLPGYEPEAQTDLAINYINQHKDKPFCLFMSWGPPHDPYKAPDSYMKQFPPEQIGYRPNVNEREMVDYLLETDKSEINERHAKMRKSWRHTLDNEKPMREMIQGYYAATKALDDCIATLVKAIDKAGLRDNTILVFTSDHGDMLGSHRMASKQMPYEESISIPFLIRYPNRIPAETVTDALLSPVDIMPTLLALADIKCPNTVEGIDLTGAAIGKRDDQQDAVLIMKMMHGGNPWLANGATNWRGVRTKRYTYARLLDRGLWVLYDNQKDPYQLNNLIDNPAYKQLRRQLEAKMQKLLKKANDPVDSKVIADYSNKRLEEYKAKKTNRPDY